MKLVKFVLEISEAGKGGVDHFVPCCNSLYIHLTCTRYRNGTQNENQKQRVSILMTTARRVSPESSVIRGGVRNFDNLIPTIRNSLSLTPLSGVSETRNQKVQKLASPTMQYQTLLIGT